jgi:hypothetical protein
MQGQSITKYMCFYARPLTDTQAREQTYINLHAYQMCLPTLHSQGPGFPKPGRLELTASPALHTQGPGFPQPGRLELTASHLLCFLSLFWCHEFPPIHKLINTDSRTNLPPLINTVFCRGDFINRGGVGVVINQGRRICCTLHSEIPTSSLYLDTYAAFINTLCVSVLVQSRSPVPWPKP